MSLWLSVFLTSVRGELAVAQAEFEAHEAELLDAARVRCALKDAAAACDGELDDSVTTLQVKVAEALKAVPDPQPAGLAKFVNALKRASADIERAAGGELTSVGVKLTANLTKPVSHREDEATNATAMANPGRNSDEWRTRITKVAAIKATKGTGDACLVLIYPPGPEMGKRFPLSRNEIVLGRGADCDVQVDRDSVSRRHARVFRSGESWSAEDLQSTNGSYVNDVAITKSVLRDGDLVKIGAAMFKFLSGTGIEASYHEEIYRLTIVDALTGAHNKRYFFEFLEREIARCERYRRPLSLLMCDIDHFKQINDKHGHLTGDFVLREISRRVLPRVRREDLCARYGGEEFAVVLPETDLSEARTLAEQIRRSVDDMPFEYEGDTFSVTISVGVACIEGKNINLYDVIKTADDNLYRAKQEGRNRVVDGHSAPRWVKDLGFRTHLHSKVALAAASLAGRSVLLARQGGAALIDDLEGLLFTCLRDSSRNPLRFGRVDRDGVLLVSLSGANAVSELGQILQKVQFRVAGDVSARALPDAPPVFSQVVEVGSDRELAVRDAIRSLVKRLADAEASDAYPTPIAIAARNARAQSGTLPRAMSLVRLHETILRWLASCVLADVLARDGTGRAIKELRTKAQKPVPTGSWMSILREAVREIDERCTFASSWKQLFDEREAVLATLEGFISARNDLMHRGGSPDERMARKIVDDWEPRLEQLLAKRLNVLVPLEIVDINFDDSDEFFDYGVRRWTGDSATIETTKVLSRHRMRRGSLYLVDTRWDRAISFEPLVLSDVCPACGSRELFMINRLNSDGTSSEYVNPATGHSLDDPDHSTHRHAFERLVAVTPERV